MLGKKFLDGTAYNEERQRESYDNYHSNKEQPNLLNGSHYVKNDTKYKPNKDSETLGVTKILK